MRTATDLGQDNRRGAAHPGTVAGMYRPEDGATAPKRKQSRLPRAPAIPGNARTSTPAITRNAAKKGSDPMRQPDTIRADRARRLQPALNAVARRNRTARELAATMQLHCAACGSRLTAHVGARNRWKGCPR